MFKKRFVDQWCGSRLIQLTLASVLEVSTAFARWLFNLPINDETFKSKVHNEIIHLPSAISFVTKKVSVHDIKQKSFFIEHEVAIKKVANGENMFDTLDLDVLSLQFFIKQS